jgi:hypothetical protein
MKNPLRFITHKPYEISAGQRKNFEILTAYLEPTDWADMRIIKLIEEAYD